LSVERVYHLDWLKVLIVYGIVVFHVSLVFSLGTWLVTNHDRSLVLSAFAAFCFPWGIPAMFLIAGADAWFGLRSHTIGQFVRGRFTRLVVPLVPGLLVISPLQRFVTSRNPPPPLEQLPSFYVAFFRDLHLEWSLQVISQYLLHLWFLAYLFVISLVLAPALAWLCSPRGRRVTGMTLTIASHPAGVLLLGLPLLVTQLILRPRFSGYQDWADVATYTLVFLWGAIIFSDRRFEAAVRRQIRWLLAGGLIALLGFGLFTFVSPSHRPDQPGSSLVGEVVQATLWSLFIWSWLHAVLYLGFRWLDFPHRVLKYARESVLAVYVIHHPIVLFVASFLVTWNLALWPKFALTLVATASLTFAVYEFGVRRWAVTRLLFGLGPVGAAPSDSPSETLPMRLSA
jgi:surface polysaccharide O-acyltransferase-like enzyme